MEQCAVTWSQSSCFALTPTFTFLMHKVNQFFFFFLIQPCQIVSFPELEQMSYFVRSQIAALCLKKKKICQFKGCKMDSRTWDFGSKKDTVPCVHCPSLLIGEVQFSTVECSCLPLIPENTPQLFGQSAAVSPHLFFTSWILGEKSSCSLGEGAKRTSFSLKCCVRARRCLC